MGGENREYYIDFVKGEIWRHKNKIDLRDFVTLGETLLEKEKEDVILIAGEGFKIRLRQLIEKYKDK